MTDARERIETRRGLAILLVIVVGITPMLIPEDATVLFMPGIALAVLVAGSGGILAGFIGGRSSSARVRYVLAGALCTVGVQLGYRLMPEVASMGKYINTIPAILGGLPGGFVYLITYDDAEAADRRWYEREDERAADLEV